VPCCLITILEVRLQEAQREPPQDPALPLFFPELPFWWSGLRRSSFHPLSSRPFSWKWGLVYVQVDLRCRVVSPLPSSGVSCPEQNLLSLLLDDAFLSTEMSYFRPVEPRQMTPPPLSIREGPP